MTRGLESTPFPPRRRRLAILAACLAVQAAAAAAGTLPEPVLEGYYRHWLDGVAPHMTEAERRSFSALAGDLEREVFIRRFWQARRPAAGGSAAGRHRPLEVWYRRFEEARQRFGSLAGDRAQALLLAGTPARVVVFAGCRDVIRPLRIWAFGARPDDDGFYLVFYAPGGDGDLRAWSPADGSGPLLFTGPARERSWPVEELIDYARKHGCFRFNPWDAGTFAAALRGARSPEELRRSGRPPLDAGWLERFAADLAGGRAALPGGPVVIDFPGRYQQKTVVRGRVSVPLEELERNAEGQLFDRVVIAGDVRQGPRLADAFRVVHLLAGSAPGATVTLDFYRRLRPGAYNLSLRVEDANGLAYVRETRPLEVPRREHEAPAPAGRRMGLPGLTRSEVGVLTTFPSVEILPPGDDVAVGEVEVAAVTAGGPIERVDFLVDGALAAGDGEPPYAAVVGLGEAPRPHRLEAVAYDPAGRELARDEVALNAGPPRFAVRLAAPRPDGRARVDRVVVEVDVPAGETLDRVEIYLDRERIATLREAAPREAAPREAAPREAAPQEAAPRQAAPRAAPFVHPLPGGPGTATYVRAVATLASGESREDLAFVGSAVAAERIDVRLVELFTTVVDGDGRFVTGLSAEDFRVLEDGVEQPIGRFDRVENLAINVALLMDVSASMRRKLDVATRSAQRFFETVLRPTDRASLLTFNHDIRREVPFTADVADLRRGASGFRARGTTRLYDGVVYAVHAFGGLEGKRALVLLSDGHDVDSDFHFRQVLERTLRAGVAVYPIALGPDPQTVADLESLAGASGGRFFPLGAVTELDAIYRRIEEELRSQYLLVYVPPAAGERRFRRVEVQVLSNGLHARSIHGYYP